MTRTQDESGQDCLCGFLYVPIGRGPIRLIGAQHDVDACTRAPERADREGDSQPLPSVGEGPAIHELVQADLQKRLKLGVKRYGRPLQARNGRNALQDAYEEALDLACYLRQALAEQQLAEDDGR